MLLETIAVMKLNNNMKRPQKHIYYLVVKFMTKAVDEEEAKKKLHKIIKKGYYSIQSVTIKQI